MRWVTLLSMVVALSGCALFEHGVVVAPKPLVEACLQEAYPASGHGWGPMCASLNEWAKLHEYAYGGGPPMPQPLSESEAKALAMK